MALPEKEIKVSNPQDEILLSTKQRMLCLAGQGGGKSHTGGLLSADFVVNYPHVRGFIGANTYGQLTKSTLDRIFKVWMDTFGWTKDIEFVVDKIPPAHFLTYGPKLKSYENTISFDNGCLLFTGALNNYKVIDGVEFGWAILDETKDTREEAVKEVITGRLRQKGMWVKDGVIYTDESLANKIGATSWNPMYILTSPAKVEWINIWFELDDKYEEISKKIFSKTDYYSLITEDKHIVIYSTYHNEDNLPPNYIEQRKKDLIGSPHLIDMLIYGSPIAKIGGEFFSAFERLKHVGDVPILPQHNMHISLDFNVVPYITMLCCQIVKMPDKYQVRIFEELCLPSPKNNTEDLCKEFERRHLQFNKARQGLFFYGDASGKNRSTVAKEDNFEQLERTLRKYLSNSSNRVHKKNPSVNKTRDFCNKIFAGGFQIEVLIDNGCKNLIADLEFLKEAPDGGKLIEKTTDKVSGTSYEKYGHTSDAFRYLLISAFWTLFDTD